MIRRDLAPIIARVLVENPPELMSTRGTLLWIFLTWPDCSGEEALRAIEIADELHAVDCMAREA
ncbi:hypothetical protein [Methylobacterium sp. 391_Methyba4]|uniref:hypothetical protein n=1 Tax=Methylobacterium sp. 391_Methyba4 TaxID=3038924 RepID=UPI00241E0984|nr:hypothetical protein [Methylobacterium sp. 391_Methyba4]WFS07680.1 hypothetical protein P9K36_30765 [Methylobacterium sp. 391_Methyba4]